MSHGSAKKSHVRPKSDRSFFPSSSFWARAVQVKVALRICALSQPWSKLEKFPKPLGGNNQFFCLLCVQFSSTVRSQLLNCVYLRACLHLGSINEQQPRLASPETPTLTRRSRSRGCGPSERHQDPLPKHSLLVYRSSCTTPILDLSSCCVSTHHRLSPLHPFLSIGRQ